MHEHIFFDVPSVKLQKSKMPPRNHLATVPSIWPRVLYLSSWSRSGGKSTRGNMVPRAFSTRPRSARQGHQFPGTKLRNPGRKKKTTSPQLRISKSLRYAPGTRVLHLPKSTMRGLRGILNTQQTAQINPTSLPQSPTHRVNVHPTEPDNGDTRRNGEAGYIDIYIYIREQPVISSTTDQQVALKALEWSQPLE